LRDFEGIFLGDVFISWRNSLFGIKFDAAQSAVVLGTFVVEEFLSSEDEPTSLPQMKTPTVLLVQPPFHDDALSAGEVGGVSRGKALLLGPAEAAAKLAEFGLLLGGRRRIAIL